jgi:hypothetical protein
MSVVAGPDYRNYKTASELLAAFPQLSGRDNYYMLYPQGPSSAGVLTYCDMTTDGGGWMMIARSHPSVVNYGGQNWGWQGGAIGNVKDFTQAYQAGWWTYWNGNATFTSYLYGNRSNLYNNAWGYFAYKVNISSYSTFTTSDTLQSPSSTSTLRSDTSVYTWTTYPGMQSVIGFPVTATTNNIYFMRDCCGFAGYGGTPTSFVTTYCGSDSVLAYSGPWCGGSSIDGSGNFLPGTTTTPGGYKYGGTNQYMIMVR